MRTSATDLELDGSVTSCCKLWYRMLGSSLR